MRLLPMLFHLRCSSSGLQPRHHLTGKGPGVFYRLVDIADLAPIQIRKQPAIVKNVAKGCALNY